MYSRVALTNSLALDDLLVELPLAHASSGRLRPERGERWDAAERALVHTLRDEHGWVDAFRALHGYEHREASWTFSGDPGPGMSFDAATGRLFGTPRQTGIRPLHVSVEDNYRPRNWFGRQVTLRIQG